MAPRPKQEYEEREADEDGTPWQRFEKALKKVMAAPKPPAPTEDDKRRTA